MKRLQEIKRTTPKLDSVLPLLDLMAANHALRLGMKIPPTLKRAMDHRHRVLSRRHPKPSRLSEAAKRKLLAGIPKPTAETRAQHEAEWLGRAKDVIARYR
jgi:hypothetical protein